MPAYKSSVSIEQPPEAVFDYVSDPATLPTYAGQVVAVESSGDERIRVTTRAGGHETVVEGWFRVHEHRRRVEWGVEGPGPYHGWMEVDAEGEVCSVTAEIHVDEVAADADERLDRTLFSLKEAMERR